MTKKIILYAVIFFSGITASFAQTEQEQRIQASYVIAFGHTASDGEVNYWKSQGNRSIADMVSNHRNYIKQNSGIQRGVINKAYVDALGRVASEDEFAYWMKGNDTYTMLMQNHMNYLAGSPGEYAKVIKRSYRLVFNRTPSGDETAYWQGQPKVSYLMLVAYHQDWQRQNRSGNPSGSTINLSNAPALSGGVSVSPGIATEAAAAAGLAGGSMVAAGGGNMVAAGGGNMVAAGGGNMVAAGGGNMVAAGGGNMVAAGGGN